MSIKMYKWEARGIWHIWQAGKNNEQITKMNKAENQLIYSRTQTVPRPRKVSFCTVTIEINNYEKQKTMLMILKYRCEQLFSDHLLIFWLKNSISGTTSSES